MYQVIARPKKTSPVYNYNGIYGQSSSAKQDDAAPQQGINLKMQEKQVPHPSPRRHRSAEVSSQASNHKQNFSKVEGHKDTSTSASEIPATIESKQSTQVSPTRHGIEPFKLTEVVESSPMSTQTSSTTTVVTLRKNSSFHAPVSHMYTIEEYFLPIYVFE